MLDLNATVACSLTRSCRGGKRIDVLHVPMLADARPSVEVSMHQVQRYAGSAYSVMVVTVGDLDWTWWEERDCAGSADHLRKTRDSGARGEDKLLVEMERKVFEGWRQSD